MTSLGKWAGSARTRTGMGARKSFSVLVVTAVCAAGLAAVAGAGPAGAAPIRAAGHHHAAASGPAGDETTVSQNDLRNGWDPNEPTLTPAAVQGGQFGQIFKTSVNGQVYGQPLVVGNTLVVATENDWVYGLDATTGAVLWKTSLGTAYHITSCQDLTPNIGVTSTGVYDPSTNTVYEMGLVHEINWEWHLFGLNLSTGAITFKQRIVGHPTNDSHLSFSALPEGQRASLLLMNGWVYAAFASHCDHGSYNGYVAGVNTSTNATTLWADESGVSNEKGGIWQSGGGVMSDGSGRIFVTSGNGISPPNGAGNKPPGQLAESVIRLSVGSDGTLSAQDFFSPSNAPHLDSSDADFGSGGPTGLPFGTSTFSDILMQAGKFGTIYLLNRDDLGGRNSSDQDLASVGPIAAQFSHPVFFADTQTLTTGNASSSNDYMIFVGKNDYMREYKVGVKSSGKPSLTDINNSTFTLGFSSGAPVITSNGTDPATGLIWEEHHNDSSGSSGFLGAWKLLGVPRSGGGTKLSEIWAAPIGTGSKFTEIATQNGRVYLGTRDGNVYGFGITGAAAALTRSGTAQFQDTAVGSSAVKHVSLTATRTVTVTGATVDAASTPAPFTLGPVTLTPAGGGTPASVKFPVTLHKGDVLRAAVTFAPSATGGATGAVSFTTGAGSSAPASIPLVGNGTTTGLFATNPALSFVINEQDGMLITNVPVGIPALQVTSIVNDGDVPVTVKSVTPPTGTYRAVGLPKPGTVIKPGEAIPVKVIYTPQHAVTSSGSFTITASRGTSATVTLTGTGLAPITKFTASPGVVHFGSVPVGHTVTKMIKVVNAGNQPALMGQTGVPGGPFGAPLRAAKGLPVNGDYDLVLPVTFHPTKAGAYHGTYKVTWSDRSGQHSLNVPITGTGAG
jgi:outer membrane protein assembly factor BamB